MTIKNIARKKNQHKLFSNAITVSIAIASSAYMAHANAGAVGGVTPGSTLLTTVATWLQAIGVITVTIALMLAGYKFLFQQARLQDISNIVIGGILIGGAALIAGLIIV